MKCAMLVYQGGIANVFEVNYCKEAPEGRNAKRLLQHTYGSYYYYAKGLQHGAGWNVRTAWCNKDRLW